MWRTVSQCIAECLAIRSHHQCLGSALQAASTTELVHAASQGTCFFNNLFANGQQLPSLRSKYTWAFKKSASTPGLVFWDQPKTPGTTHRISIDYKALGVYTGAPVPHLSQRKANSGGRNLHGHITVRHRGGGIKKVLRDVDFTQTVPDSASMGIVERIEFDPNRSGFISLVRYPRGLDGDADGLSEFKYHLAPHGLREGDEITTGPGAPIQLGNRLPLQDIPLGVAIHNIEMIPGKGGQLARAAGTSATIKFKEDKYAVLSMPSGEVRRLPLGCHATIGTVSNPLLKLTTMGKAGVNRQRGRRPKVRGRAMNPVDHPHGGRTNGGRPSCTPWGVYCKGTRTRLRNKWSNQFIITRKGGVPIDKFVQAKKWRAAAERERKLKSGATMPVHRGPPTALLGPQAPTWGELPSTSMKVTAAA